nr:Mrp/NBP35 family ATP-binding protein [Novosphingobium sp. CCH12-A3]
MSIDEQALRNALGEVAGDRLQTVKVAGDTATVMLEVGGLERLDRDKLEMAVRDAARKAGVGDLRLGMTAERKSRVIIAVGSGKGGVGKSTLSANLAVAMHRLGRKVGLVDADIYGPSQPRLLLTEGRKPEAEDNKIHPIPSPYGVPMLSMGHLVQPGQAIAWRGPMAGNALGQLIDAHWGDTEIIVVDLPPGTGDVQLTMLSKHKPAGAVIVSTPQDLALMDATRAIGLFEQGKVPIIGMVENMAGYICPHCGEESDPFGVGGAEAAAKTMGLPFLGRVPLDMAIRRESDAGNPPAAGDSPQAEAFLSIARSVLAWLDGKR